jgi:hypothetical protein
MVRVSGAANFHMHHNNTFGIQHIIIIGKIIFLGNLIIAITNISIKCAIIIMANASLEIANI